MTIKIHPIRAFNDNYIWILHDEQNAVVVDPGDATVVENYLSKHGLNLIAILITHHHYDHVDGLETLQNHWHCVAYGPDDDRIPGHLIHVGAGDEVVIDSLGLKFHVMFTPGHTLTHICYHDEEKLFCGDTLFSLGCGRMFEGTPEQFHHSLVQLKHLPDDTNVYCTHEYTGDNWRFALEVMPNKDELMIFKTKLDRLMSLKMPSLPSTIATEKRLNPFLNCELPEFKAHLEQKTGQIFNQSEQVFAFLREWKNSY